MLSAKCISCLVNRQFKLISRFDDEEKKAKYMREVLGILGSMKSGESSPVAVERMDSLFKEYFGENRSFEDVKRKYNDLLLEKEDELFGRVNSAPDRILAALKFSRIGNYIDFGALSSVNEETLSELIDKAQSDSIDPETYKAFRGELERAKRLVFIPDNCGEVIFDKLLLRALLHEYPSLDVTALVRGRPVLNDVTEEDARYVGLDKLCRLVGNGSGIAGTFLPSVSDEARALLSSADVIVAKGQGNFETMFGCGLNVYYLFLCKCEWFESRFNMKMLEGVFARERDNRFGVTGSSL